MSASSNIVDDENPRNLNGEEAVKPELKTEITRVLLVDADSSYVLRMLEFMKTLSYEVKIGRDGEVAMRFLKKNKHEIDLVIWDVHVPKINGLEALNFIVKEKMDLPVVITSSSRDYTNEMVMNSIKCGACDFLLKPLSKEVIVILWRHAFRKRVKLNSGLDKPNESKPDDDSEPDESDQPNNDDHELKKASNHNGEGSKGDNSNSQKPRMIWTTELHNKFVLAYNELERRQRGAYPKAILNYMKTELKVTENISRSNVASHLQKYRLNVTKKNPSPEKNDEEDIISCWQNGEATATGLTACNTLINSNMNLHERAALNTPYVMNDGAALNTPIQYSSNNYMAVNNMNNSLSYAEQFHQLQQQQQYYNLQQYYKPEPVRVSSSVEFIYNATLPHDHTEFFPTNLNFDQTPRDQ